MAAFVAFELWIPLLAAILRAFVGSTVPTAVQVIGSMFGLAVPTVVGLALSDYLADRKGLVRPYQPKGRPAEEPSDADEADEADEAQDFDGQDEEEFEDEDFPGDDGAAKVERASLANDLAEPVEADALEDEAKPERHGRRDARAQRQAR
jgi:hypothetical protein